MHSAFLSYVFVAICGAHGAIAGFGLHVRLQRGPVAFPRGTHPANVVGCFVMGITLQPVGVGFCGNRLCLCHAACICNSRARHWAPLSQAVFRTAAQ